MSLNRRASLWSLVPVLGTTLALSACVFWSGQYGVTLAPDGKTATLAGYGGADAEARLADFVRGYCGGQYQLGETTMSDDGRTHGVRFECEIS
jgi:hypothetical protein